MTPKIDMTTPISAGVSSQDAQDTRKEALKGAPSDRYWERFPKIVRALDILKRDIARRDPFKWFRLAQGPSGCAGVSFWATTFLKDVQHLQKVLLDDPTFVGPLVHWAFAACKRSWTPTSLLKMVCAKAGEQAFMTAIREGGGSYHAKRIQDMTFV